MLVKFFFWWTLLCIFLRSVILCGAKYPRTSETSMGADIVSLAIQIMIFGWIALVLHQ